MSLLRINVWGKCNDAYSLSIRVQTTINHISFCFLPQYQCQRKCFFESASWKGIVRHIVWTLINNGKLPNQIVRLAAIVAKMSLFLCLRLGTVQLIFWIILRRHHRSQCYRSRPTCKKYVRLHVRTFTTVSTRLKITSAVISFTPALSCGVSIYVKNSLVSRRRKNKFPYKICCYFIASSH